MPKRSILISPPAATTRPWARAARAPVAQRGVARAELSPAVARRPAERATPREGRPALAAAWVLATAILHRLPPRAAARPPRGRDRRSRCGGCWPRCSSFEQGGCAIWSHGDCPADAQADFRGRSPSPSLPSTRDGSSSRRKRETFDAVRWSRAKLWRGSRSSCRQLGSDPAVLAQRRDQDPDS